MRADRRNGLRRMADVLDAHARVAITAQRGPNVIEGARLPVVVLSPGGDMSRYWHSALAQDLASHGYAVVALSHAHSGLDLFPRGGLLMSHARWRGSPGETEDEALARDEALSDTLAADARFVLDQLEELNRADPKNRFTGRLDLSSVAILGHSRGGKTAARACSTDSRFKACVVFDNVGPQRERERGLQQPMITLRSADSGDWDPERIEELRSYLAANETESHEVVILGARHHSFTDLPFIEPRRFGSRLDADRAHRIVSTLTRAFLERVLRGAEGSLEAAAADFSEVEVTKTAG